MHITPLTDRYASNIKELEPYCGESALNKYRILVECKYLIALSEAKIIRTFTAEEKDILSNLWLISETDAETIKQIEQKGFQGKPPVYHDIRAVENYIRYRLQETSLKDCTSWIHFGLTSDDTNNIAYALLHTDLVSGPVQDVLSLVLFELYQLVQQHRKEVMIGRTHGQAATPTTLGKELYVFYERIRKEKEHLLRLTYEAKLNGATGTLSAHVAAFPNHDWRAFSITFITSLNHGQTVKIIPNLVTTQIEPHDSFARICDSMRRLNTILVGLSQDIWGYISDGWLKQKVGKTEGFSYVGSSSTMPHKLNPTDFENAEANLTLANAIFGVYSSKLLISRFQRDLSDSSVMRNAILPFAYSINAYKAFLKGFTKVDANKEKIQQYIEENPEVITEGIQTILRAAGDDEAYEKMKGFARGKKVTLTEIRAFIQTLNVPAEIKARLLALSPETYIGIAEKLIPE